MNCRHCGTTLRCDFLDLGFAPPSNAYLTVEDLAKPEVYFPLRLQVCEECWLVQTEDYASAESLFSAEYAYFSSASTSWLAHAARYVEMITSRLGLNRDSMVIEVASNDGYLLKKFVKAGIPCLGVEPTASTAEAAEALGIPVRREFFGEALGKTLTDEGKSADLILGNNVYAHVPDINDFTRGLKAVLKAGGTVTLEFPHVMQLIEHNQFDTVYHEHFSYLSLFTVGKIFDAAGLRVFDVEELPTHGGSLRVYGCHAGDSRRTTEAVTALLGEEQRRGLQTAATYADFQAKAEKVKNDALAFLLDAKREGKTVAAYGAAAKGNTLLNFAGVKPDLLPYVCDAAAAKQNKFMPGSHIPILHPDEIVARRPDYVMILPWNIATEVRQQLASLADQGTRFVTAVPELKII
ncbi:Putative NDP-hexose 3-C-methyltransferase protein [Neorhizobium galegae bv. officinalis bv. officinalis str. HAMBI 1141]|uniref:Putative NDP-hexose 3-C-methyltransferase protein n=1 Tax=Neorhizobium galegae bv. officinalis bv. officinalis str. HAMBI 1141 TaxID=1028801 RepID=A0A068T3K5_NEOGA|nr:class I SAM-dependent methyltransferase [Neorhizobium galegae]CDN52611.1 Putative NDP-hexose 3-C-methyltransferase protein [Neorhizobium galegae bv. officinalis bv. officinalis str. HAMBI 1141]